MSCFDAKIYIIDNGIDALALGAWSYDYNLKNICQNFWFNLLIFGLITKAF